MKAFALFIVFLTTIGCQVAEKTPKADVKVGAYYFHGWSGQTDQWHLPPRLKEDYPEREPIWGWYTNTVDHMEIQIDYAADNGLDFFNFVWFNSATVPQNTLGALNQGLDLYLQSNNRERLGFSLFISNHDEGFAISPSEWNFCADLWIELFKKDGYHKVDGRPVITFMRHDLLVERWGSVVSLKNAFKSLKDKAILEGLKEPLIGIHALSSWDLISLKETGYDFFTGYNYGNSDCASGSNLQQPYSQLPIVSKRIWNGFVQKNILPYAPVVTTGWDMRPWETGDPVAFYYSGRCAENIVAFTSDAINWVQRNPSKTIAEPFITLYAWNENGEGGYLTPTRSEGDIVLQRLKEIID